MTCVRVHFHRTLCGWLACEFTVLDCVWLTGWLVQQQATSMCTIWPPRAHILGMKCILYVVWECITTQYRCMFISMILLAHISIAAKRMMLPFDNDVWHMKGVPHTTTDMTISNNPFTVGCLKTGCKEASRPVEKGTSCDAISQLYELANSVYGTINIIYNNKAGCNYRSFMN